jgi:uncharacterized protein YndB with AHSA1/START domain
MASVAIAPIRLTVETRADPARAWAYLTEPEHVAEWFTEAIEIGRIGDTYRLDFGGGSVVEGTVVALDPGRLFAHQWAWIDAEPRQTTLVTWRVEARPGGGATVGLIHDGWAEAGADTAIRDDHEAYWSGYLDDLRDILEDATAS